MKKNILGVFFILGIHVTSYAYSADLSLYQNIQKIQPLTVTQPAIVQVSHLDPSHVYVIATDKGEVIEQQFQTIRKTNVIMPIRVEACMQTCVQALTLADVKQDTTFDFPLITEGLQKGVIKITYAKLLETDRVIFQTTNDSYVPSSFKLMIDGKLVLNTIQGSVVKFPKMKAKNVEISFEYAQPIRFREVGIGSVTEDEVNNMIRFVYQPEARYILYEGYGIRRDAVPTPPINLFAKTNEAELVLLNSDKNPLFKEQEVKENADSDSDGVFDLIDNCPMQSNQDQKDGNGNGIGDVCDDYDYDGVATYKDNCPSVSNYNQRDVDRDGLGDACDSEESRFTEKHGWVPWVVFGFVFVAILGMGYEVVKKTKNNQ